MVKLRTHRRLKNKRSGLSWGRFIAVEYGGRHSRRGTGAVLRGIQWNWEQAALSVSRPLAKKPYYW